MDDITKKSHHKTTLKIIHSLQGKTSSRIFQIDALNYQQIIAKVSEGLSLDKDKKYRWYYVDKEGEDVDVYTAQQFQLMKCLCQSPKLRIQENIETNRDFRQGSKEFKELEEEKSREKNVEYYRLKLKKTEGQLFQLKQSHVEAVQTIKKLKEEVSDLKAKSKFDLIEEKKKQLEQKYQQFKEELTIKFKGLFQERLKQQLSAIKSRQKEKPAPQPKIKQPDPVTREKINTLSTFLGISEDEARKMVDLYPETDVQALINMYIK